jgi:hypothetical protein
MKTAVVLMLVAAAAAGSPAGLQAQELNRLPFHVTARLGGVNTPDYVVGCKYGYGTWGVELRSRGSTHGYVGYDRVVSLGGPDVACLGRQREYPDGRVGWPEQGFHLGTAQRLSAGVAHAFGIDRHADIEVAGGAGFVAASSADGSRHPWTGVSLRLLLLNGHVVLAGERGFVRYPVVYTIYEGQGPEPGREVGRETERHWGGLSMFTLGLRF